MNLRLRQSLRGRRGEEGHGFNEDGEASYDGRILDLRRARFG